jgi:endonuclease YncB( thermonuclease family)
MACGLEAKQALAALVGVAKTACSGSRRDKYDRLLVTCRKGDLDINRDMVGRGLAVSFGDYEVEEAAAKAARRGLWAGNFVLPSQWRATHRPEAAAEKPHFFSFF